MSLKGTLDRLEAGHKNRLLHAFNQGLAQYVELPGKAGEPRRYIGVNVQAIPNLKPDVVVGVWSEGTIAGG